LIIYKGMLRTRRKSPRSKPLNLAILLAICINHATNFDHNFKAKKAMKSLQTRREYTHTY
jgi:hypothetical protein